MDRMIKRLMIVMVMLVNEVKDMVNLKIIKKKVWIIKVVFIVMICKLL